MIHDERISMLNDRDIRKGRYVLYWMQASQREEYNHALEYAADQANAMGKPLVVVFGLTDRYPEANLRHYTFMLEGLRQTAASLKRRGIQFVLRRQSPPEAAVDMAGHASLLVADTGYQRAQRQWRDHVADHAPCRVAQVETDAVVPVEVASDKEEYMAATLRPKLLRHVKQFLVPLRRRRLRRDSLDLKFQSISLDDIDLLLGDMDIDRSVGRVTAYSGGMSHAKRFLRRFIAYALRQYAYQRNDPGTDMQSHLSPYLHFGQISPLAIALAVQAAGKGDVHTETYLEELIVRRELSMNFVRYNPRYDCYEGVPGWARRTLRAHEADRRPARYSLAELEGAATADAFWNAAMKEMLLTGKMHGYMRMYWGKRIMEWTPQSRDAFGVMLYLNNKYFLDGRDPNSYAAVAWCFGKHDRPWGARPIFGNVRTLSAKGLQRKYDMAAYLNRIWRLEWD